MYYCCGITEKGTMKHNEDSLLLDGTVIREGTVSRTVHEPFITAVSDGVSGEVSGETASRMCLEKTGDIRYSGSVNITDELMRIHLEMREYSEKNPEYNNMQTTLCGLAVDEEQNIISFNIGDSRLYRLRNGVLEQLTRDQSLVQLLYEEGTITFEEKKNHVHRNIIFPVMGSMKSNPQIDELRIDSIKGGDLLMLCTDGLSDYVEHDEIESILNSPQSPESRLELLVKRAIECGSNDNITAIIVVYSE